MSWHDRLHSAGDYEEVHAAAQTRGGSACAFVCALLLFLQRSHLQWLHGNPVFCLITSTFLLWEVVIAVVPVQPGSIAHGHNSAGIIPLLPSDYPVTILPSLLILSAGCLYPQTCYPALLSSYFNPAIPTSQLCPPQRGTKACVLLTHCHVPLPPAGIHLHSCPHLFSFMLWDQGRWGHSYQNPYQCCCLDSPSVGSVSPSVPHDFPECIPFPCLSLRSFLMPQNSPAASDSI